MTLECKLVSTVNYPKFIEFVHGSIKQNEVLYDRPLKQQEKVNVGQAMIKTKLNLKN